MDWSALENDLQSFGSDYQVEFKVVGVGGCQMGCCGFGEVSLQKNQLRCWKVEMNKKEQAHVKFGRFFCFSTGKVMKMHGSTAVELHLV